MAVEKRMKGDESEKACACDAAQASRVAVVESFIVVVVMRCRACCVGVGVGRLVDGLVSLGRDAGARSRLCMDDAVAAPTAAGGGAVESGRNPDKRMCRGFSLNLQKTLAYPVLASAAARTAKPTRKRFKMFAQPRPRKSNLGPAPKKRKTTHKIEEITFDKDARTEYLTGFHKRKQARIKFAQGVAEQKAREERIETRKQVREALKLGSQSAAHVC